MTTILTIILASPAVLLGALSALILRRVPLPAARLAEQDVALCRLIYARGDGHDWACPAALRTGACLRVPCAGLAREKLAAAARASQPAATQVA